MYFDDMGKVRHDDGTPATDEEAVNFIWGDSASFIWGPDDKESK